MNTSDSRKNKWIAGGAILVMMLAGGSMLRLRSLQQQAAPDNPKAMAAAIDARLALSPEEQARRLKLVTRLRDAWKPWAQKHQGELRRMLAASPSDAAARDVVWNNIPGVPRDNEKFVSALNPGGNGAKGEVFTWNAIYKAVNPASMRADEKKNLDHGVDVVRSALEKDFVSYRDIAISQSTQTGKVSVSLWASGRVTEDTSRDEIETSPRGFTFYTFNRKEILPPYDFLTSTKGKSS